MTQTGTPEPHHADGASDAIVHGGYTQAALDREYDNQAKFPGFDFKGFLARCLARSEAARARWGGVLDIAYGPAASERLDLFKAETGAPAAVEIFFHGGYWRMLDKRDFSYVANGLVPNGRLTIVVNYGLIPTVDMDELIRQCRAAIVWAHRNVARFGGDPARIHLSGHSAGGHIVAMMLATDWPEFGDDMPADLIKGACAISGIYDLAPIRFCFLNKLLRLTAADVRRSSPAALRPSRPVPLTVVLGGKEGDEYLRQSRALVSAWTQDGYAPALVVLPEDDHFTTRGQLDDPTSRMCSLVIGPTP